MTTKAHMARWADLRNRAGWVAKAKAQTAAMLDGANYSHIIAADNATRDFAAADELRAPGRLSVEDMRRELGESWP